MDLLYEESSVSQNAKKGQRIYKILNVIFWIALVIGIIGAIGCLMNIPFGSLPANATPEQQEAYALTLAMCQFSGFIAFFFLSIAISTGIIKKRVNVSYDYIFVSGELRIAKIFNINRRKLVVRLFPEDFLQVGDIDNASYDRLKADPATKEIVVTSNATASEGKFFMYILAAAGAGKKQLYVLECREELLINILKFTKRGTLESDYVMQEKKAAN